MIAVNQETIDTSSLGTSKMSKDEAFSLFKKDLVLLGLEENQKELQHLQYVIALAAAREIVKGRPEAASILSKHLPSHHKHANSEKKMVPAVTFLIKPYPYQGMSSKGGKTTLQNISSERGRFPGSSLNSC